MKASAGIILADQQVLVDQADLKEVSLYKWHISPNGYVAGWVRQDGKRVKVLLHRFLMKPPPDKLVDHANMNRLDNRRANLRICTKAQNAANTLMRKSNTSGFTGVSWDKRVKKWAVYIRDNGTHRFLGHYADPKKAHAVYQKAAQRIHGEFART